MQLVTFGVDKEKNLIIQFLIFIQPYTQQTLILYQLETAPVPIIDQKHTSTHLYSSTNNKVIHCTKFLNIHLYQAARIKNLQEK